MKGKLIAGLAALALTASCAQQEAPIAITHVTQPGDVAVEQVMKPAKDESVWQQYLNEINPSVICIRDKALYESKGYTDFTKKEKKIAWLQKAHGTGTIFEEVEHNGRTEYLILTNHHVAYSAEILSGARMLKQELLFVENEEDSFPEDDISLEKIATSPDNDMTILRTINAPKLPVAKMKLGLPKILNGDDRLFTSGFPLAENKIATEGQISSTTFYEANAVPFPLEVYSANISIDGGQSGSPVVIPVKENGETVFYCVGLVYAKANNTDTIRLITPIDKATQLFETMKNVPSKRPQLDAKIDKEKIESLDQVYTIGNRGVEVGCQENVCAMNFYLMAGSNPVRREFVQATFSLKDDKIDIKDVFYSKDGTQKFLRSGTDDDDQVFSALINYCDIQEKAFDLVEQLQRTTAETRQHKYLNNVLSSYGKTLNGDMRAFFYELYQNNKISEFYLY